MEKHKTIEEYTKKMRAIFADSYRYFENPEKYAPKKAGRPAKSTNKKEMII